MDFFDPTNPFDSYLNLPAPEPTLDGIRELQALYRTKFEMELTAKEAQEILSALITIEWEIFQSTLDNDVHGMHRIGQDLMSNLEQNYESNHSNQTCRVASTEDRTTEANDGQETGQGPGNGQVAPGLHREPG